MINIRISYSGTLAKKDGTKNPERWKSEKLEEIKEDFVNQHRKKLENL